ncbi:MAG: hypothetical protein J6T47_00585 [Lachnospiraceae bacterium]|nr:hypothetical protein [Lachnospiraceae bacterium]
MKIYRIMDDDSGASVGTLLYYENSRAFIIELVEGLDEWTAPLLLTAFVKKGILTIPRNISELWVRERVIPADRQNIGAILSNHRLKTYDEIKLLELSEGRCCQDSLYIQRIEELPDYVVERQKTNLVECLVAEAGYLLCFFADHTSRKIYAQELAHLEGMNKVLKNMPLFLSGRVGMGGYFLTFDNTYDVPAADLYRMGAQIPLGLEDMILFVHRNVYDTSQSCEELDCSRQNVDYLVKQGLITPVKKDVKGKLFLKSDVQRVEW